MKTFQTMLFCPRKCWHSICYSMLYNHKLDVLLLGSNFCILDQINFKCILSDIHLFSNFPFLRKMIQADHLYHFLFHWICFNNSCTACLVVAPFLYFLCENQHVFHLTFGEYFTGYIILCWRYFLSSTYL